MKPFRSHRVPLRGLEHHVLTWGDPAAPTPFLAPGWMDVAAPFQFPLPPLPPDWSVPGPAPGGGGGGGGPAPPPPCAPLILVVGAINNEVSRFLPGGFYYKTFMWPQSFWKHVYEPFIRRAAGLGKAPEGRDPDTYEQIHVHCDVLVIGGGVAGLAAAEAAAANGAKVIIADENPHLGGLADISGGTIDGQSLPDWSAATGAKLYAAENVHVLNRTTVVGHWHHNFVMLFERVADHDPALLSQGVPRHRLWKVRSASGDPRHGFHRAAAGVLQQ